MNDRCQPARSRVTLVGAAHLFLINPEQNEVLLLRRANTGYYDGWWSVPAGHIDPGESALDTLGRETAEETGILIDPVGAWLVHVMHRRSVESDCGNGERVDFFFTAELWSGEPTNLEPHKCDELRWWPLYGLPNQLIPYVYQALSFYQQGQPYSQMGWWDPCPRCGHIPWHATSVTPPVQESEVTR